MPTDINSIQAWAMIISTLVTSITGFFIVQTFLLQAKASIEQSKITKLEVQRSIMEKRPLFFASRATNTFGDDEFIHTVYEIKLLRNDITAVTLKVEMTDDLIAFDPVVNQQIETIETGMIENTIIHFHYKFTKDVYHEYKKTKPDEDDEDLRFDLTFTYTDAMDIEYVQEISIGHDFLPYNYPPSAPQLKETYSKLIV